MHSEGRINKDQRGILKDLILSNNSHLYLFINEYDNTGNSEQLYSNILKLIDEYETSGVVMGNNTGAMQGLGQNIGHGISGMSQVQSQNQGQNQGQSQSQSYGQDHGQGGYNYSYNQGSGVGTGYSNNTGQAIGNFSSFS
jgi:hypothetical protein